MPCAEVAGTLPGGTSVTLDRSPANSCYSEL